MLNRQLTVGVARVVERNGDVRRPRELDRAVPLEARWVPET